MSNNESLDILYPTKLHNVASSSITLSRAHSMANLDVTSHDCSLYLRVIGQLLLEKRIMEEKLQQKDQQIKDLYNKCLQAVTAA